MKRSLTALCAGGFALLLSGCNRISYETKLPRGGLVYEQRLNYFVFGLVGSHDVDLDQVCPSGAARWYTEAPAFGLLDVITLGIYTPRQLVVECAGSPSIGGEAR